MSAKGLSQSCTLRWAYGWWRRTLDLRFRHGIHALEMHLLLADLGKVETGLKVDVE